MSSDNQSVAPTEKRATTSAVKGQRGASRRRGAEPYDTLLWRVQPMLEGRRGAGALVAVIGCDAGAGVTTVAANLAIRAADHRIRPALLIDCNASKPRLGRHFRLAKGPGLAEVLAGDSALADAVQNTKVEGLDVLPFGTAGLLDRSGLDPQQIEATIDELRESYELVVLDMPAANDLRQLLLAARRVDAAILVVRSETTSRRAAEQAAARLRADDVNLVGSFVTRQRQYLPNWIRRRF
ncbi:MAG: CpsD/CapB family tyrosine-protein kinase [Lacipirellulaceae bacterium]